MNLQATIGALDKYALLEHDPHKKRTLEAAADHCRELLGTCASSMLPLFTNEADRCGEIVRRICAHMGADVAEVLGPGRRGDLLRARKVSALILHREGVHVDSIAATLNRHRSNVAKYLYCPSQQDTALSKRLWLALHS